MRLLVTGGCGFVGSNFIRYVLQHYGPEMITNVDLLTTGRLANVDGVAETFDERYEFLHADVKDEDKIEALLLQHQYYAVVHFAAEATGAEGTRVLLEHARQHGVRRFLLVSREGGGTTLEAAEAAALAAWREHGQEVVVTRATDSYGLYQPPTSLIPSTVIHALRDELVGLPQDGARLHDWLHVEDLCAALFTALLDGQPGAVYWLRPGHPLRDVDLVHRILEHLGKSRESVEFVPADAPPEPAVPAGAAAGSDVEPLAWKPRRSLEQGLRETIEWYVRNPAWWEPLAASR